MSYFNKVEMIKAFDVVQCTYLNGSVVVWLFCQARLLWEQFLIYEAVSNKLLIVTNQPSSFLMTAELAQNQTPA